MNPFEGISEKFILRRLATKKKKICLSLILAIDNQFQRIVVSLTHRRQPRRGCRGRIPANILVGGDINWNVPTNIRGSNVVEYELLIAIV